MSDEGDAMALCGVVVADAEVTGAAWEVTGAARARVMAVSEDVPLVVTAVLARPVFEPPP